MITQKQKLIILSTAILAIIISSLFYLNSHMDDKNDHLVSFSYQDLPSIGQKDAPVKIIEFADFKCPTCKKWSQDTFPELKKDYIDTGKVELYFANYLVIHDSESAALIGKSIFKQNKELFWKYYEAVYKNQQDERLNWANLEFLLDLAKNSCPEIDLQRLSADVRDRVYEKDVQMDITQAKAAGVNATPTIFINGQKVNFADYKKIKDTIEKELRATK